MLANKLMGGTCDLVESYKNNYFFINADGLVDGSQAINDLGSSNSAITVINNARVSTAVKKYGTGSVYFDGGDDQIRFTNITLDGAYTIECRVYVVNLNGQPLIVAGGDGTTGMNNQFIRINSNWQLWFGNTSFVFSDIVISPSTWTHLAVVRDSSNVIRAFKNGVMSAYSTTDTATRVANNLGGIYYSGGVVDDFNGYLDEVRITKSAIYTSNFTPTMVLPELFCSTTTSLLINADNLVDGSKSIVDSSGNTSVTAVGDARVSTAVKKYGTGSVYFDGSGDYLALNANYEGVNFGSGDFTIESWIYPIAIDDVDDSIFTMNGTSGDWNSAGTGFNFGVHRLHINGGSTSLYSTLPSINTWSHLAVSRAAGTVRVFLNGNVVLSVTTSANIAPSGKTPCIGIFDAGRGYFNGYLDDYRVTKGVALYVGNFTPPLQITQ